MIAIFRVGQNQGWVIRSFETFDTVKYVLNTNTPYNPSLARTLYIRCLYGVGRNFSNMRSYTAYTYGFGQPNKL